MPDVLVRTRRKPGLILAIAVLAFALLSAVAPSLFTGQDPLAGVPAEKMQAPRSVISSAPTKPGGTSSRGWCTVPRFRCRRP